MQVFIRSSIANPIYDGGIRRLNACWPTGETIDVISDVHSIELGGDDKSLLYTISDASRRPSKVGCCFYVEFLNQAIAWQISASVR